MSLTAKLIRGSSVGVLEQALKLGFLFVTTPLMVRRLGVDDYGTWLLALAIIAYFQLLDLGLSFSGTRFLGRALGAENSAEFQNLAREVFRLFRWIAGASLALTALVLAALPGFVRDQGLLATVRWIVLGFGLTASVRFATRIFEVVLKSHVRYDLLGVSSILKTVLQGGLVIGFLLAGHGLMALLLVYMVTDLLDQALLFFWARQVEPGLRFLPRPEGPRRRSELFLYSATAMATSLGQSLRNGIDPLIVARVGGVAAVPLYSVGARFLGVFTDLVNAIFGGNFVAAFSQLHGRGDEAALRERFLQAIRHSAAIAALGGCGLLIYGPPFIERWVGPDFALSTRVLAILTPPTVLALAQYPIWSLFYSQNRQHWLAVLMLAGGAFNLALSLFLASRIGFLGVVWATLVEMTLVYGVAVPWLVFQICGVPLGRYVRVIAMSLLKVSLVSAAFYGVVRTWLSPDYVRLLLIGLANGVVFLPFLWVLVFTTEDRSSVLDCGARLGLVRPRRTGKLRNTRNAQG